jgi:hypothetical protein
MSELVREYLAKRAVKASLVLKTRGRMPRGGDL